MSTKSTVFMACVNLYIIVSQIFKLKVDKLWLTNLVMRVNKENYKHRVNLSTIVHYNIHKYIIYKYLYKYIRVILVDSRLTKHLYRLTFG